MEFEIFIAYLQQINFQSWAEDVNLPLHNRGMTCWGCLFVVVIELLWVLAAKIFPVVKNQHLLLCTLLIGNSLAMEVCQHSARLAWFYLSGASNRTYGCLPLIFSFHFIFIFLNCSLFPSSWTSWYLHGLQFWYQSLSFSCLARWFVYKLIPKIKKLA